MQYFVLFLIFAKFAYGGGSEFCSKHFQLKSNMVIMAHSSFNLGANFLKKIPMQNRADCLHFCCNFIDCDAFVFEEKTYCLKVTFLNLSHLAPNNCYLFNCRHKNELNCKFARHNNFSIGIVKSNEEFHDVEDENMYITKDALSKHFEHHNQKPYKRKSKVTLDEHYEHPTILVQKTSPDLQNGVSKMKIDFDTETTTTGEIEEPVGAFVALFFGIIILLILVVIAFNRLNRIETKASQLYKVNSYNTSTYLTSGTGTRKGITETGNKEYRFAMGRVFLFCYNLIFIVFAVIVLTISTLIQLTYYQLSEIRNVQDVLSSVPLLLIILSLAIIFIAVVGLCISISANNFFIFLYYLCMFVLFAVQVALGLFFTSHKNYIGSYVSDLFQDSLYKYMNESRTQKTFDIIQHDFECCGLRNYTDWYKVMNRNLPKTCCNVLPFDGQCNLDARNFKTIGCLQSIEDYLVQNITVITYVIVTSLLLQIIGLYCVCGIRQKKINSTL